MAKKNSTKTATKEALQAAQPVLQVFAKWQGISAMNRSPDWTPYLEPGFKNFEQSDMPFLMNVIQNNVELAENGTLETRQNLDLFKPGWTEPLTTAFKMAGGNVYQSAGPHLLLWRENGTAWEEVTMTDADTNSPNTDAITEIERFGDTIIALTEAGEIFTGPLGRTEVRSAMTIPTPPVLTMANLVPIGCTLTTAYDAEHPYRVGFQYCYANRFGTTLGSDKFIFYSDVDPLYFGYDKYIMIQQQLTATQMTQGIEEIDIYLLKDDAFLATYYGSCNPNETGLWQFFFRGTINDVTGFTTHQSTVPTQNTTKGPNAKYMTILDGRAYYWNGTGEYANRVYIGGGAERPLSIAMGAGGRFIDVEPGLGSFATNVLRFKTFNGATINTTLFGHENAHGRLRYNIMETNFATSNEISQQDYMPEMVAGAIGCQSRRGSAVFEDGLYVVDRYGLGVTTQASESQNQLRVVFVSDVINNIFNTMVGYSVDYSSLICIDGIIYICFNKDVTPDEHPYLDTVILCYDITQKGWYSHTMPNHLKPLRLVSVDYNRDVEGLGIITESGIYRLPTTSPDDYDVPTDNGTPFKSLIQSGEIGVKMPLQQWFYNRQVVFKWDYIIGDCTITLNGQDIYGRQVTVVKNLSYPELKRNETDWLMVEKYLLSWNLRIEGPARFRLTEIQAKTYATQKKTEIVYGFDDHTFYRDRDGNTIDDHHYTQSYNNYKRAIIT